MYEAIKCNVQEHKQTYAKGAFWAGSLMFLGSAFAELKTAATWAELLQPSHVFGVLGALVAALGAWYTQPKP